MDNLLITIYYFLASGTANIGMGLHLSNLSNESSYATGSCNYGGNPVDPVSCLSSSGKDGLESHQEGQLMSRPHGTTAAGKNNKIPDYILQILANLSKTYRA